MADAGPGTFVAFARLCAQLQSRAEGVGSGDVRAAVGEGAAVAVRLLELIAGAAPGARDAIAGVFKACRVDRGDAGSVVTAMDQQAGDASGGPELTLEDAAELFEELCDGGSWVASVGLMQDICRGVGRTLPRDVCRVVESLCATATASYLTKVHTELAARIGADIKALPSPPAPAPPPAPPAPTVTGPLAGKKVCFTGGLSIRRAEASALARDAGAIVTDTVGYKTDYVVVGPGAGGKKQAAEEKGCTVWDEQQFREALGKSVVAAAASTAAAYDHVSGKKRGRQAADDDSAEVDGACTAMSTAKCEDTSAEFFPPAKKRAEVAAAPPKPLPSPTPPIPVAAATPPPTGTTTATTATRIRGSSTASTHTPAPDVAELLQRLRAGKEQGLAEVLTTVGTDTIPQAPLDPEHPQRITTCTTQKVVRRMTRHTAAASAFYCDTKYDGERLIVHMPHGKPMAFYSRNRHPVPERKTPGVAERVRAALNPQRAAVASGSGLHGSILPCTSVVLDCEILSAHTVGSQNKVPKGELHKHGPRLYPFDILYYNGHNVTAMPLVKRRGLLHLVVEHVFGRVEHVEYVTIDVSGGAGSAEARLQKVFDMTITYAIEGLVVKPVESPYTLGGTHWVKLKRGYIATEAKMDAARISALRGDIADDATADSVASSVRMAAAVGPGAVICSPLTDTLDCLVPAVTSCRTRLVLAVADSVNVGRFVTCGTAPIPKGFRLPRWGRMTNVYANTSSATNLPCQQFCSIRTKGAEFHVGKAFARLRDCPVVEVASKWLVENPSHTCNRLAVGPDARVVRLRDDKDDGCTSTAGNVTSLFNEGNIRARCIE